MNGSSEQRGGNHGCDQKAGTFFENHFWESGDNVSFGLSLEPGSPLPPGSADQHVLASENASSTGEGPTGLSCGNDVGAWREVSSSLGDGDDSVRLDAKGLEDEAGQEPYRPIPKSIDAILSGGRGDDTIRGHKGFDRVKGGGGADLIRVDDGRRDVVDCGRGRDKADVDPKDDIAGCERKT